MSEYKLDLSNYIENEPTPWTDEQYKNAFQSLAIEYHKMKKLHEESNITVFCALTEENSELKKENEKLMIVSKQYNTLTNHIRMKAENNPGVSRYIDLVNYIDRLEQK